MKQKNEIMQIKGSEDTMKKLREKAETYNQDADWLVNLGVEIVANLDAAVLTRLHSQAGRLELPLWQVLENYLIDRFAYEAAEKEVNGPVILKFQFIKGKDDKLIIREALYDLLKESYVRDLRNYDVLKGKKADRRLAERMAELNRFLKPGEQAASVEELQRRERYAGIDAQPWPDKRKEKEKKIIREDQKKHYSVKHET